MPDPSGPPAQRPRRRQIGVAIAIPDPYGKELHDWREQLGDPDAVKIPPHVTLLPPRGVPEIDLDTVVEHLEEVAGLARPFRLHLRGAATFRPVSPVVFVQLVQGMAECALLERGVRSGPLTGEVGFSYYPHVTVAHELDEGELDRALSELDDYEADFEVTGFSLFERARDGFWRPIREFWFPRSGSAGRLAG